MNNEQRKERIRQAFGAVGQGDPGAFLQLLSPELVYTVIGTTRFSRRVHGIEELLSHIVVPLSAALAGPLTLHIDHMIAEGDCVAWQAHGESLLQSGAPYNNTYCFVFRFAGEHVVEVTEYLDTALVDRAFGVPADRDSLLHLMDLNLWEMFRDGARVGRGSELFETSQFWMAYCPRGTTFHNMVMVRDSVDVTELLRAAEKFYAPRTSTYSIWIRNHADTDLEVQLREKGFTDFTSMPGMVLLSDPGTQCAPADLDVRTVVDDKGRCDFRDVVADAYLTYGAPPAYAEDAFFRLESVCAPHLQAFVGYLDDTPVAGAAVYVTHSVAGIGWVGTRSDQRRRGYAEAVTWAAIREGFRRGATFANLQASPMGEPVYTRMGFITPTQYRALARPS